VDFSKRLINFGCLEMASIVVALCLWQMSPRKCWSATRPSRPAKRKASEAPVERLRLAIVLSRHGVRSPISTPPTLGQWSSEPWPDWEVPPGSLTPHGVEALKQMGLYLDHWLSTAGLGTPGMCLPKKDVFLYADTDQRNLDSTIATFQGFGAGCGPYPVFQRRQDGKALQRDPIFVPMVSGIHRPTDAELLQSVETELASQPELSLGKNNPAVIELANVVSPQRLQPAHSSVLNVQERISVNSSGDPLVTIRGPVSTASGLIANLALEYANGMPLEQVGWGRVDQNTLRRLSALNTEFFNVLHRAPVIAQAEASNMLQHILDTLEQAEDRDHVVEGSFGGPSVKLVYLSGHDTNIASLGALIGVHWTVEGVADAVPPDSELVFELWERMAPSRTKSPLQVRLRFRAQNWEQLRLASPLTARYTLPTEQVLPISECDANSCELNKFLQIARSKVNQEYVENDWRR
jgi:4-phytase / acid phosphatase